MNYDIQGKTILITGANRGIGETMVHTFVQQGAAKIYAAVRSLASAAPLVEQYGDKVVPLHLDLLDSQSITLAAELAQDVHIVVNNAGILKPADLLGDDAIENMKTELEVNTFGLMYMAQAFANSLKNNGGGVLIQLNSVASMKAYAGFATYCASKAASYSLTQSLRDVLEDQGTIVLSVHPGPIATDMGDDAGVSDIAESPTLVPLAIIDALKNGDFHVFPDSMAKQMGDAYNDFAINVIEAKMSEGEEVA